MNSCVAILIVQHASTSSYIHCIASISSVICTPLLNSMEPRSYNCTYTTTATTNHHEVHIFRPLHLNFTDAGYSW